jgi:regulator of replication initiation timing
MSAHDRKLKIEQYSEENKRLRQVIGTLTILNTQLQNEIEELRKMLHETIDCPETKFVPNDKEL